MSVFILAASTTAIRPLYTSPSPGEPPEKSLLKPSTRPPAAPTARRSSPWPRASRAITSPGSVVVAPRAVASSSGLSTYPRSARARACNCRTIRRPRNSTCRSAPEPRPGSRTLPAPASRDASSSPPGAPSPTPFHARLPRTSVRRPAEQWHRLTHRLNRPSPLAPPPVVGCGGVRCRAVPAMMDACRTPRLPPKASVSPSCWPSCRWALTWA